MDKNYLIETAGKLKQVSPKSAEEYFGKSDRLVAMMNIKMAERTDIESLIGKNNADMMKDNHSNHARFIASILKNYNPEVMVDTVLWVFRAYRSHGFTSNYWAAQLNLWIVAIKEILTPECLFEVFPYYAWMQINIPIFVKLSDEKLESTNSLH